MVKFKVGDIIVGNDRSLQSYSITCKGNGEGVVVGYKQDGYGAEENLEVKWSDGGIYWVDENKFELKNVPLAEVSSKIKIIFSKDKPKGELKWGMPL